MGFSGYFLIVADFIQWAKAQGIPVGPGRGSGAGSVVAWALTITDLDPLRFDLLFERFLNPERVSMPDFDIDFCQDRRDEVIDYVRREYGARPRGADHHLRQAAGPRRGARRGPRARPAVRPGQQGRRADPQQSGQAGDAAAGDRRRAAAAADARRRRGACARLLEIALQLEGLYRHACTHAAGVVIGDRPLIELVPLYRDPRSDFLVTQYSMKYVEQAGLVKFDFLGLTTLTILQRAVGFLQRARASTSISTGLPLDDAKTYEMLQRGDAGGVFQFEGQGMRDMLRQMRPDRFEDLIAAVALYRPGPMANIPDYCRRKHGETWEAPHPELHDILAETYGIMVYQEQVMQIAQTHGAATAWAAPTCCAARWARRSAPRWRRSARSSSTARPARGIDRGEGRRGVRPDGEVRRLRLQQIARRRLRAGRLPDRLDEGQPSRGVHRRLHEPRDRPTPTGWRRCGRRRRACGIRVLPPDINRSGADFTRGARTATARWPSATRWRR